MMLIFDIYTLQHIDFEKSLYANYVYPLKNPTRYFSNIIPP